MQEGMRLGVNSEMDGNKRRERREEERESKEGVFAWIRGGESIAC